MKKWLESNKVAMLWLDFLIGCQHHGMLGNAINENQINIFSGRSHLYFYVGR